MSLLLVPNPINQLAGILLQVNTAVPMETPQINERPEKYTDQEFAVVSARKVLASGVRLLETELKLWHE
jgi:hypothetical protein